MQIISQDEVKKISQLARIAISEEEAKRYATDLSNILAFVDKLKSVDTEKVAPIDHISGTKNRLRPDAVKEAANTTKAEIIKNFPSKKDRFNKVKAVF